MFLRSKRSCIAATVAVAALSYPLSSAVQADSWYGTRYNGNPCNGYFLTPSVYSYGYQQSFRDGVAQWRNVSSAVTPHLRVAEGFLSPLPGFTWIPGEDKCYVGVTRSPLLIGLTRFYDKTPSGVIYQIPHRPGIDQNWYMCTVALYHNQINSAIILAGGYGEDFEELRDATAVHEVGHSLKLAHPNLNDGTYRNNIPLGFSLGSVMKVINMSNVRYLTSSLEDYDRQELRAKWGN